MATTAINIAATSPSGKKLSKAIADINPSASNSALQTFSTMLNGLTTNTIGTVTKITKEELGNEEPETPATNPIQSVVASTESAGAFTVTGSGTSYNVTVDRDKLLTALENDSEGAGSLVSVNVVLPNTFNVDVYNNKVHVDYGILSSSINNLLNGAVSATPYNNEITLFYMLLNYNDTIVELMNGNESITIKFDSVTVSGVKYAPWQVTFTSTAA